MPVIFIGVLGIYLLFMLLLLAGWRKAMTATAKGPPHHRHSISIVIPFRNEEQALPGLLLSLKTLQYPHDHFEILLVNDHSEDHSEQVVREAVDDRIKMTVINAGGKGKKQALSEGISHASGEIIVTTDADCTVPPHWLHAINEAFLDRKTQMMIGGVSIVPGDSFFAKLQSLEFCSLTGTAAATCTLGAPVFCNGANLSFRKSAFDKVSGYEGNFHIPSGDDEFLMRKMAGAFGKTSIRFLNARDAVVATRPQQSLTMFFQQRIRWASKWKYNSSWGVQLLAILIWLFQFGWLASLIGMTIIQVSFMTYGLMVAKIVLEGLFLLQVGKFVRQRFFFFHFLLLQALYPIYVLTVGVLSNFWRVEWKRRPA